jgi:hypothetical protein
VEHSEKINKIVPRGTILTIFVVILLIFAINGLYKVNFIQQSILERKIQYLSIPVNSIPDVLVGQGVGSYVELLSEKSPGLFSWQLQPIHNTYILLVFEVGVLPILALSLFLLNIYSKKKKEALSLLQKCILIVSGGVALLLLVDHYTWDIEQGQFLFVLLITFLTFAFNASTKK